MTCCGALSTDLTTIEDDFVAIPLMDKGSGFLNWRYGTRTGCKTASFEGHARKFLIWKNFPCAVLQFFSGGTKPWIHAKAEDGRLMLIRSQETMLHMTSRASLGLATVPPAPRRLPGASGHTGPRP